MKAGDLVIYYDPSCSTPPERVLLLEMFHKNNQAFVMARMGCYWICLEDIGIDMVDSAGRRQMRDRNEAR
jgi:hypothetical protein